MSHSSDMNQIVQRARISLRKYEAALLERVVEEGFDARIRCSWGCHHCCKQVVAVSLPEAMILVEPYWKDPMVARIKGRRFQERMQFQVKKCNNPKLTARNWFSEGMECLFLKDGLCERYQDRPLACRALLVMSDPANCAPPPGKEITAVMSKRMWGQFFVEMKKLMRRIQVPCLYGPLPVMLEQASLLMLHGVEETRRRNRGTPMASEETCVMHWGTRFLTNEYRSTLAEIAVSSDMLDTP